MTFNTAVAHLPDGNTITYMDSGAVEGCQQYTTIVMLHGTAFNSHVFEPLHALATQYHLRLFAVQRRGYSGSSNYSENELADLQSGNCAFLDRLTVLLGHLIYHLIKKYDLPKPNAERTEGGVALLGWSIGCATSIPFLSDMNVFEPEQYELLRRYIIKLVLYDPPYAAFGFNGPAGKGTPSPMFGKSLEEHYENFKSFVSSYFDHPPDWDGDPTKFDLRPRTERATTDSWTPEMWEKIFQSKSVLTCERPLISEPMQTSLWGVTQRALFDEASAKSTFPEVDVLHIVCWKSNLGTLWGYHCMKSLYQERYASGRFVRPLSFKIAEDANHFWHWDSPHEFLQLLADVLQGKQRMRTQ